MNAVIWNFVLAFVWTLMTGTLTLANFALGFAVGAIILLATQSVAGLPHYTRRAWKTVELTGFTAVELVLANLRVARDILRSQDRQSPGVIDLPLEANSDAEITLLATLINVTPGTTAIEVTDDRAIMYIHSTNIPGGDVARARQDLKDGFERRLLEVMR